jgi:hypothetical protein
MKAAAVASLVIALMATVPASTADNFFERLATCQDSWLAWKDYPDLMEKFADRVRASFVEKGGAGFWVPKSTVLVAGLPVVQAFPQSVGTGIGFSVLVDARFEKARTLVEQTLGRSLTDCETSDNMHSCGLEIGEKRTVVLMAEDNGKAKTTLIGCYYYYEK